MRSLRWILASCFLISLFNGCNPSECSGIKISEVLGIVYSERGIDYCKLIDRSVAKDQTAIREFSLLRISDGVGYEHGDVLVQIILRIDEDTYLDAIANTTETERIHIKSYLEVGLEYGSHEVAEIKLEDAFPKIAAFLK